MSWLILPGNTCPDRNDCIWVDNIGWRIVLLILGAISFLLVLARMTTYTIFESPRYLITRQRYQEAVDVLNKLAELNNKELNICELSFRNSANENIPDTISQRFKILLDKSLAKTTILVYLIFIFVSLGNDMYALFH